MSLKVAGIAIVGTALALGSIYLVDIFRNRASLSRTVPEFDLERYEEPWFRILMPNDLPYGINECSQKQIKEDSDGTLIAYIRAYDRKGNYFTEMDRPFACNDPNAPGRCTLYFRPNSPVAVEIVDTDYESYAIEYLYATRGGVKYMESVSVYSRDTLNEGTQEFDDFMELITAKMAEYLPKYSMDRLSVVKQASDCQYQLFEGEDPQGIDYDIFNAPTYSN